MASGSGTKRLLILGGTTEARKLAERLAPRTDIAVTLSFAGRTALPVRLAVPARTGGFGGAAGLADYLTANEIDALIDATHPYASVISANAVEAARQTGVAFITLRRPPWIKVAGDRWTEVNDTAAAADAVGARPRRVFVALGRNDLVPFIAAPQHVYLFRSVDPIDPPLPLPQASYITARGPFSEADDRALMQAHGVECVIAKNSGGGAAFGKIAAARDLGIEVILMRRPIAPAAPAVETIDAVMEWLNHALTTAADRGV
jgi:precorrin-6A/cobalt-precorrin-6A reductase